MDKPIPKVKTIKVLLDNMGDQQDAIFKMAFKMHNTTNYVVIDIETGDVPDLILVDTDASDGLERWQRLKEKYIDIPVAMFTEKTPTVTTPLLPKPVKFETLFPILRSLAQGGNIYDAEAGTESPASGSSEAVPKKTIIQRFNPKRGLLGALKMASEGSQDIAVLHEGKPVLIVFPSIQRVLLTVDVSELEVLAKNDNLQVVCRAVPDNPQWKAKAKVTIMSCLWQVAIWTAQGRLVYPMTPQTVFTLKRWPNLTRLAPVPESMRLSAFLTKTSVNLNVLYKIMPLDITDILNYLAATSLTGFLVTDDELVMGKHSNGYDSMNVNADVDNGMSRTAEQAIAPSETQPRSLLQRLMRKLFGRK